MKISPALIFDYRGKKKPPKFISAYVRDDKIFLKVDDEMMWCSLSSLYDNEQTTGNGRSKFATKSKGSTRAETRDKK